MRGKPHRMLVVGGLVALACVCGVFAEEQQGAETMVYIVKRGDTLWDISARFLKSPWMWPKLWEQNRYIANPHLIFPGEPIALVGAPPVAPSAPVAAAPEAEEAPAAPAPAPAPRAPQAPAPKVAAAPPPPEEPSLPPEEVPGQVEVVRPKPIEEVRAPVERPGTAIFYARAGTAGFVSEEELAASGSIVTSRDEREMLGEKDTVGISLGSDEGVAVGDKFMIFDTGMKVHHPRSGSFLGYMTKVLGELEVRKVGKDSSTAEIISSNDTISVGDRIKPMEASSKEITLQKTTAEIDGYIVASRRPVIMLGEDDVVYLDLGTRDGIAPGNIFLVYRPSKRASDPLTGRTVHLPPTIVGKLVVINVHGNTSTALVTRSREELRVGDPIMSDIFFQ